MCYINSTNIRQPTKEHNEQEGYYLADEQKLLLKKARVVINRAVAKMKQDSVPTNHVMTIKARKILDITNMLLENNRRSVFETQQPEFLKALNDFRDDIKKNFSRSN